MLPRTVIFILTSLVIIITCDF